MRRLSISEINARTGSLAALFEDYHHQLAQLPFLPRQEASHRIMRGVRMEVLSMIRRDAKSLMNLTIDANFDIMGEKLMSMMDEYVTSLVQQISAYLEARIHTSMADRNAVMARDGYMRDLGVTTDDALASFTIRDASGRRQKSIRVITVEVDRFYCKLVNAIAMCAAIRSEATRITLTSSSSKWDDVTLGIEEAISRESEWSHYGSVTFISDHT